METTQEAKPQQMSSEPKAKELIDQYQRLKGQRSNFESYWQSLHDYYYIEADDINRMYSVGNELSTTVLWDSTTLECADVLASGFMNYLTPPTSKWHILRAKSPQLRENKAVSTFLEDCTEQVHYTLNRSNFYNQIIANYKGSGVYGTSAMFAEDDDEDDVRFYSLPIKNVCLVEDSRGVVKAYFIEFEYTAEQAADRWGMDALATAMREEAEKKGSDKKHPFILYIAERYRRDVNKSDKKNMPIEACWIDVGNKSIIEESGYHEFPASCHRFDKRPFIPWGFSPAMKALPFARILNASAKTNLRAMMKNTDPPVAIPHGAFIQPFSANPRSTNYYNKTKMDGKDIFAFGNFGNPEQGMMAVEYYANAVKSMMYHDVFLAFNSITKDMNNPEVYERISEKMSLLGPAVGRYISEMINPTIIRVLGILFRKGKLPPVPAEFMQDPTYEIDCVSQLAQAQRRSELNALVSGLTLVGQMAQITPDVLDKVSTDKVVDEAWAIIGAPARVLRDDAEVQEIRDAKAQAMQQAQMMNSIQQGANAMKTGSEIDVNLAKSQEVKK